MAPPATPPTTAPRAAPSQPPASAPTPAPTAAPAPAPIAVRSPGVAQAPRIKIIGTDGSKRLIWPPGWVCGLRSLFTNRAAVRSGLRGGRSGGVHESVEAMSGLAEG